MDKLYCINCEKMVSVARPELCNGHLEEIVITEDTGAQHSEIDCCEFPLGFAYSEPPESSFVYLDNLSVMEWDLWCEDNRPGIDELIEMDLAGQSLELEMKS